MKEHFGVVNKRDPKFSVSCQHYSFAVNAFVDVVNQFDADKYSFILRETQTGEIIDDVAYGKSELGILYLSDNNEEVISKLLKKNDLVYEQLIEAKPHVFISSKHPLADREALTLEDLEVYPYLSFEQGDYNSFYFSNFVLWESVRLRTGTVGPHRPAPDPGSSARRGHRTPWRGVHCTR